MKQKHVLGFVLLAISIIGISYSLFMDVSNGGVINLSKVSERQIYIIISGFLFVSAIIILHDLKQEDFYEELNVVEEKTDTNKKRFNVSVVSDKNLHIRNYAISSGVIEVHQSDESKISGGDIVYIDGILANGKFLFTQSDIYVSVVVSDGYITSIRNKGN